MSNEPIPLSAPDITRFARSISQQLKDGEGLPSHLSLLNILARATGFQNYQHMKAAHSARRRLEAAVTPESADYRLIERTLQHFDESGRLMRWPSRRPVQELCLWVLWSDLPSEMHLHERNVNAILNDAHLFGDPALLRRSLVGMELVNRNLDGSDYQRQEKRPPIEAPEVVRTVRASRTKPRTAMQAV